MIQTDLNHKQNIFNQIKSAFDVQDLKKVLDLCPSYMQYDSKNALVCMYFGFALTYMGLHEDLQLAKQYIDYALELDANNSEIHTLIGIMYRDGLFPLRSISTFMHAIQLDQNPSAYYNLGITYISLGEIEKGIDLILYAIQKEENLKFLEDLNQFIYYDPRFSNKDYVKIAKLFYQTAKEKLKIEPFKHSLERYNKDKTKLKIGFFCAEGLNTPTWPFLEKIFTRIDRNRFEIHCYIRPPQQLTKIESDEIIRIKQNADQWNYCHYMSVKETAEKIYNDQVDILIDLSGYLPSYYNYYSTEPSICVFMYKPAPVQVTWYGFWGTTGIEEIDYLISTTENIPSTQDHNFTEKIYRLKNGYTHAEIFADLPEQANQAPCIKNGYITFASFNRAIKLNSQVYKTWSEILKQIPNSKLLIKYSMLAPRHTINMIWAKFEEHGISRDRILFRVKSEKRNKFLSAYNNVDIALEPIPFGGVTTTINALTMGVPVIAKYEEDRVVNGGTCSLLKAIGCENLTASSDEEYVKNAVDLANNIESLTNYRKNLRNKVLNSSINSEQYTKDLVEAFEFIWQDCCREKIN